MKTQIRQEQATGKTIRGIIEGHYDRLIIWMTDDTFLYIEATFCDGECANISSYPTFNILDFGDLELIQSGFITRDALEILRKEKEGIYRLQMEKLKHWKIYRSK